MKRAGEAIFGGDYFGVAVWGRRVWEELFRCCGSGEERLGKLFRRCGLGEEGLGSEDKAAVEAIFTFGEALAGGGGVGAELGFGAVVGGGDGFLCDQHLAAISADHALGQSVAFAGGHQLFKDDLIFVDAGVLTDGAPRAAVIAIAILCAAIAMGLSRNFRAQHKQDAALGADSFVGMPCACTGSRLSGSYFLGMRGFGQLDLFKQDGVAEGADYAIRKPFFSAGGLLADHFCFEVTEGFVQDLSAIPTGLGIVAISRS